jgi:hypothetical protein
VIPFVSWGAAESIQVESGMVWGVNDRRRVAGEAMGD